MLLKQEEGQSGHDLWTGAPPDGPPQPDAGLSPRLVRGGGKGAEVAEPQRAWLALLAQVPPGIPRFRA